ncbi:MAG: [FeFe] hydrogenase H-cluster maturation GTPase HydF [Victivallales bacterium]|nr:[FeFe] hydrogenase H-cluster maturation GTPase HydF [Victivallales bacterium]MCF7888845.1 [FeFe] hydrogenase H-cluster maturation GTPase HydF [Victivallales bacterium]
MINREHIGIFGKMNAGKSCVMNLLTQQETSIVDNTPGTTADTKITLQEIHGLGPVKLFDTAGFDERNILGEKKKKKVQSVLKECDLVLLIIDINTNDFKTEQTIIENARELDKQLLIIYNLFKPEADNEKIKKIEIELSLLKFYKKLAISTIKSSNRQKLLDFIIKNYTLSKTDTELLPFLEKGEFYILNIPMDEETPNGRLLRPQQMAVEYITRHRAYPVAYRMLLSRARNVDNSEKANFDNFLNSFSKRPKVIITDSQAMDIMKDWAPSDIQITTFSIMMINYITNGKLAEFAAGIKQLDHIKKGDKILIVEACNHTRIKEDIGTVQIPAYINKHYPGTVIEHNFGREFQENKKLLEYKLIIHCGGCMITRQKLCARLRDLDSLNIPYTNYGIFLSYIHGKEILERTLAPWKLSF